MAFADPMIVPVSVASNLGEISLGISEPTKVDMQVTGFVYVDYPEYEGETTVTPSQDPQTLLTEGTLLRGNITIEPIPNNYGLITWSGSVLTVS